MRRRAIIGAVAGGLCGFVPVAVLGWVDVSVSTYYSPPGWTGWTKMVVEAAFWTGCASLNGAALGVGIAYVTRPRDRGLHD